MTDRTADANDEHEVEGHTIGRWRATEADQPQPGGGEGAETEGHATTKYRASDAPAPGDEPEVEGHTIGRWRATEEPAPGEVEPEVEG